MKKFLLLALITLTMCFAAFAQKANSGNAKKELSVNEYFLQIPEQYIQADAGKRAIWIDSDDNTSGHLEFTLPFSELPEDAGLDAGSFGSLQIFKKKSGGAIIGLAVNMCVEKVCEGQLLLLDYNNGKWDNITEEMAVGVESEVPLAVEFYGAETLVKFISGCKETCDGGEVAKMFKWNGEAFAEFEYVEGP